MHTMASSIAYIVAGRQPLASTLGTNTRCICPADNFVDPFTVRFAEDMPVARLPVLDQDEDHRMVTIPTDQAQTPIRRRVRVVHKTDYEDGSSFSFCTPNRPTTLRGPLQSKRRVVEMENVTKEMKEKDGTWLKVAAKVW